MYSKSILKWMLDVQEPVSEWWDMKKAWLAIAGFQDEMVMNQ
jgi:hypothetical protein